MNEAIRERVNQAIRWYKDDNAEVPASSEAHRDSLIEDLNYLHDLAEDRHLEEDRKIIAAMINYVESGEEPNEIPPQEIAA
ncbi:hypothetical protein CSN53_001659 [Salmonella enterica subsp. diarizonae]|nr:hypothetical protein [Salmonella enterica subsp. diarizonae]EEG1123638.1 hypothetical protein [Salmonella enterica subsp. diarizonae]